MQHALLMLKSDRPAHAVSSFPQGMFENNIYHTPRNKTAQPDGLGNFLKGSSSLQAPFTRQLLCYWHTRLATVSGSAAVSSGAGTWQTQSLPCRPVCPRPAPAESAGWPPAETHCAEQSPAAFTLHTSFPALACPSTLLKPKHNLQRG